jgi:hypothetical protein
VALLGIDAQQQEPVIVYVGVTQPSLYHVVQSSVDGSAPSLAGAVVTFLMRPLTSRTPVVESAAVAMSPPDNDGHNVRYDWAPTDVAVEGLYMGWFLYQLAGESTPTESDEFAITITDQGPGVGVQIGSIVDGVSAWIPTTVARLKEDPDFGDRFLQQHSAYVQQVVLGDVLSPDAEATLNPMLLDYLSARLARRLIVPAKEYWGRQYRQVLTNGPGESASYPDMLALLDDVAMRIEHELPSMWRQLQAVVPGLAQTRVEPTPLSSLGDPATNPYSGPITQDPGWTTPARLGGPRRGDYFF